MEVQSLVNFTTRWLQVIIASDPQCKSHLSCQRLGLHAVACEININRLN